MKATWENDMYIFSFLSVSSLKSSPVANNASTCVLLVFKARFNGREGATTIQQFLIEFVFHEDIKATRPSCNR
jgi:hypothetical protein